MYNKGKKKTIIIFLILILAVMIVVSLGIFIARRNNRKTASIEKAAEDGRSIPVEIEWQNKKYAGFYEGKTKRGIPHGEGTFTAENGELVYSGTWKAGAFNGSGELTYADGTHETGTYNSGKRNGFCRVFENETVYTEALYEKNRPYGNFCKYENGSLLEKQLIVNGSDVREMTENAVLLTNEVIREKQYLDQYVYAEGTVRYVSQATPNTAFARIAADNGQMFVISYLNRRGNNSEQKYIPNLEKGDRVRVYGYYNGIVKDPDEDDKGYYSFSFISINPFFAELMEDKTSGNEYEKLNKDPFKYYGMSVKKCVKISRLRRSGNKFYMVVNSEDEITRDKYIIRYNGDADDVFLPGETLNIEGFFNGQDQIEEYEEITGEEATEEEPLEISAEEEEEEDNYRTYPLIYVMSCEQLWN